MANKPLFSLKEIESTIVKLDLGFTVYAEERKALVAHTFTSKRTISCSVISNDPLYNEIFASGLTYNEAFDKAFNKVWSAYLETDEGKKLVAEKERKIAEKQAKKAAK